MDECFECFVHLRVDGVEVNRVSEEKAGDRGDESGDVVVKASSNSSKVAVGIKVHPVQLFANEAVRAGAVSLLLSYKQLFSFLINASILFLSSCFDKLFSCNLFLCS